MTEKPKNDMFIIHIPKPRITMPRITMLGCLQAVYLLGWCKYLLDKYVFDAPTLDANQLYAFVGITSFALVIVFSKLREFERRQDND